MLQIHRTKDKVVISDTELRNLVVQHIEKQTGRKVHNSVNLQLGNMGQVGPPTASFWAELVDEIVEVQIQC